MQSTKKDKISIEFNTLYQDYYEKNEYSTQTSSHWKKYGEYQKVTGSVNAFSLEGKGFGDYERDTIFNSIRNIPSSFYVRKLLRNCKKNLINDARWIARKCNRRFSYDLARQVLTLNKLTSYLTSLENKTFCIIGDGYGSLGCLIKKTFPNSKIVYVNLGRTLLFDLFYSQKIFSALDHKLIRSNNDNFIKDFNYIEAERYLKINLRADVFINICSMQEMNYVDIKNYFSSIRNQNSETWFYSCNRVSKNLPDGTVIEFDKYGWDEKDISIFDELCPWHQKYPTNKPPFFVKFDGPIRHKLIKVRLKS